MEAREVEPPHADAVRLREELEELRASRERLVRSADADRARIERELHDGLQQQLVALAVKLQLLGGALEKDATAAGALLDEVRRDVQEALEETRRVTELVYPPLLASGGLRAALRSAAAAAGVPSDIDVTTERRLPLEAAATVYFCWLEALAATGPSAGARIAVREADGALAFEIDGGGGADPGRQQDRVEALGGRLSVSAAENYTRMRGSLPIP